MRSFTSWSLAVTFALAALAFGCASNMECSGGSCICRQGLCTQSCPQGGCELQCNGTDCRQDCAGGDCRLLCSPGAETCVLTGCTSGCSVQCNGAATCESSCDLPSCAVQP